MRGEFKSGTASTRTMTIISVRPRTTGRVEEADVCDDLRDEDCDPVDKLLRILQMM